MFADAMIRVPILPGVTPTTTPTATQQHADEAARRFQRRYSLTSRHNRHWRRARRMASWRTSVIRSLSLAAFRIAEYKPHIHVIAALARDLPTAANLATVARNISEYLQ